VAPAGQTVLLQLNGITIVLTCRLDCDVVGTRFLQNEPSCGVTSENVCARTAVGYFWRVVREFAFSSLIGSTCITEVYGAFSFLSFYLSCAELLWQKLGKFQM
jgi:hypothetical protein